jgi:cell division protein FtsA
MVELGEDVFMKPVRLGIPMYEGNLADVVRTPRYSTVIGLLIHARDGAVAGRRVAAQTGSVTSLIKRMRDWILKAF